MREARRVAVFPVKVLSIEFIRPAPAFTRRDKYWGLWAFVGAPSEYWCEYSLDILYALADGFGLRK